MKFYENLTLSLLNRFMSHQQQTKHIKFRDLNIKCGEIYEK